MEVALQDLGGTPLGKQQCWARRPKLGQQEKSSCRT